MKFLLLSLCSFAIYAQSIELPPTQYPIRLIKGYCAEDTSISVFNYQYEYNSKKNLVKSVRDLNHSYVEEHRFEYGAGDKIQKETVLVINQGNMVLQSYTLYYYGDVNLVKKEFYNPANEIIRTEETDYAENSIVRTSMTYYHNGEPRLQSFTKYFYDKSGRLTRRDTFSGTGNSLSSFTYEYSGNLLISEVESATKNKTSTTTYEYDDNNNLSRKLNDGKVIQENVWLRSKLSERWQYDLGFDACRNMCCGKTMIKIFYY
jgi:hypothetical protein